MHVYFFCFLYKFNVFPIFLYTKYAEKIELKLTFCDGGLCLNT